MYFVIDRSSPYSHIADRDIICYKEGTLRRRDGIYGTEPIFVSSNQGYIYRFQERQPELQVVPIQKGSMYISEGYHSYHPCHPILQSFKSGRSSRVLVKCIIPEGSMYYYSPRFLEYVSSCLIVLEVIS